MENKKPTEKPKVVKKVVNDPIENKVEKIDFKEILENPLTQTLLGSCKDLFKKDKPDPDVCEINIKAPSEVILKLFNVAD